jgi:hypothetical protein
MRRLIVLVLILLQAFFLAERVEAGERVALIMGNSEYKNAPHLPNPLNDATDVAAAFERLGFSVRLLRNGSFDAMRRALLDFAQQAQGADIAVLYFAGHGMEIRDENWLIPTDAELRMDVSASQEAVSLGSVMPIVSKARKLGLVILDACRDNPFSRQLQASQPGRALASRGLIPVEPPNSVLVAFAAKHGTTADDGSGRNSPFTTALLHNLELPGIEINYLFRNIHDEVYAATQQRQEPYVYGTLSKEPIYLKPATDPPSKPAQSASTSEAALAWSAVKDTRDPVELETFIRRFNDTFFGDLAKNRLKQLSDSKIIATAQPAIPAPPTNSTSTPKVAPTGNQASINPSAGNPEGNANTTAARSGDHTDLSGSWTWDAECGLFGSYHGGLEITQSADGKLVGKSIDGHTGEWPLFDGRAGSNSMSFRKKTPTGATQHWTGKIDHQKNGRIVLRGSFTDTNVPLGSCPWRATQN